MRGIPLLLSAFIAAAGPAMADGTCDLARQVGKLDVSSRLLLRETQPERAARIVGRLEGDLRAIAPPNPLAHPPAPGSPTARMRDYVDSRETLVKVFDGQGMAAAQAFLRADRSGAGIREIGAALDCDAKPGQAATTSEGGIPGSGLQLGTQVANGALGGGRRRHSGPAIEEHWTVPLFALPALALMIVLLSRLLNRRQFTRYPCDAPARIAFKDRTLHGRIADISRGGAKIRTDNSLSGGLRGTLTLESGEAFDFRIAWANSHFIGVTFEPALEVSPKRLLGL